MRILTSTAGLAWAADRHTVVTMFNPESDEGCKLAFIFSQISSESLAGILNLKVTAGSDWIAGAAGDPTLEMLAKPAERAQKAGL
jgi:hypothetical protein